MYQRGRAARAPVGGDAARHVPQHLVRLLHGEVDLLQVVQHALHLLALRAPGARAERPLAALVSKGACHRQARWPLAARTAARQA